MKTTIASNLKQGQLTSLLSDLVSHFIDNIVPESKLASQHIPILKIYSQSCLFLKAGKFIRKYNMENFFKKLMEEETLEEKTTYLEENFPVLISQLVEFDVFEVLNFMAEEKTSKKYFLNFIVPKSEFFTKVTPIKKDLFYYAIIQNSINALKIFHEKLDWEIEFQHLSTAMETFNEEVFQYLFQHSKLTPQEISALSSRARNLGNITFLNVLKQPPEYYFDETRKLLISEQIDLSKLEEVIFHQVSRAYRFTLSIPEVDKLCADFVNNQMEKVIAEDRISILISSIKKAKEQYLKNWGSVVAPYRTANEFSFLNLAYDTSINSNVTDIKKEVDFGLKNNDLVQQLIIMDKESKTGFVSFEKIVDFINNANKSRVSNNDFPFGVIRDDIVKYDYGTVLVGRYIGIIPHVRATWELDLPDVKLTKNGYQMFHEDQKMVEMCILTFGAPGSYYCYHARAENVQLKIAEIGKIHTEICQMDSKEIMKDPKIFLTKVAQVLSLTGKLTPYWRGTGCLVETWLAYIHERFEFSRPILRKIQLDCINISIPTSIEEQLLFFYFKFDSLPEFTQKYLLERSQEPDMDALLSHYRLGKYEGRIFEESKSDFLSDGEIIENFLDQEFIPINLTDSNGNNLLMWAAANNKPEFVKSLLSSGNFNVKDKNKEGKTALMIAEENAASELLKLLRPEIHISPQVVHLFFNAANRMRLFDFEIFNKISDQKQLNARQYSIPEDIGKCINVSPKDIFNVDFFGSYGYIASVTPEALNGLKKYQKELKCENYNPVKERIFKILEKIKDDKIIINTYPLFVQIETVTDLNSGLQFLANLEKTINEKLQDPKISKKGFFGGYGKEYLMLTDILLKVTRLQSSFKRLDNAISKGRFSLSF